MRLRLWRSEHRGRCCAYRRIPPTGASDKDQEHKACSKGASRRANPPHRYHNRLRAGASDDRDSGGSHSLASGAARHACRISGHLKRSEEHTSELKSLMRISYAVFCLKKKKHTITYTTHSISVQQPTDIHNS